MCLLPLISLSQGRQPSDSLGLIYIHTIPCYSFGTAALRASGSCTDTLLLRLVSTTNDQRPATHLSHLVASPSRDKGHKAKRRPTAYHLRRNQTIKLSDLDQSLLIGLPQSVPQARAVAHLRHLDIRKGRYQSRYTTSQLVPFTDLSPSLASPNLGEIFRNSCDSHPTTGDSANK